MFGFLRLYALLVLFFITTTDCIATNGDNHPATAPSAIDYNREYDNYLKMFSKDKNRLKDHRRLEQFKKFHRLVHAHNLVHGTVRTLPTVVDQSSTTGRSNVRNSTTWSFHLRMNHFADMFEDERQQIFTVSNVADFKDRTATMPSTVDPSSSSYTIESADENNPSYWSTWSKFVKRRITGSVSNNPHISEQDAPQTSYATSTSVAPLGAAGTSSTGTATSSKLTGVATTINWATRDNPLGSNVMPPVRNQGGCGACWAFVAVAAVEAALRISLTVGFSRTTGSSRGSSRNENHYRLRRLEGGVPDVGSSSSVLESLMPYHSDGKANTGDLPKAKLPLFANDSFEMRNIEIQDGSNVSQGGSSSGSSSGSGSSSTNRHNSIGGLAWIPSLSVQQLIDCDAAVNRGCGGGSPLYAFRYVRDNGLVPWSRYPYEEHLQQCGLHEVEQQVNVETYFIKSFSTVAALDALAVQRALQTGPVAVGICGTDPIFLFYGGGIFDEDNQCCQVQNHALILVGYDTDPITGQPFWVAQNSWGSGWGENGYIRLKRSIPVPAATGGGSIFNSNSRASYVPDRGICGMLVNPMVCQGGFVLDGRGHVVDPSKTLHVPRSISNFIHWVQDHWREIILAAAVVMLVLSVIIFCYAFYLDRLIYMHSRVQAERNGYTAVSTDAESAYGGANERYSDQYQHPAPSVAVAATATVPVALASTGRNGGSRSHTTSSIEGSGSSLPPGVAYQNSHY
mmetsp:Transcript_12018/g.20068  ORF Transcript_12018/g.20068 Transcript_12018/m.20068 type:complete len:738 (-) Transcript_12018:246-2459(-)